MDSQYKQELQVAFGALRNAAKISQSIVSSTDKGVVEKDDLSPVTVADFAVQALLIATVKNAFPTDSFVGEESADDLRKNPVLLERVWVLLQRVADVKACTVPESREQMCELIDQCGAGTPEKGRTWVFDPIDGTKTYVRGELYAINVALLVDGKQTVGAVGCPNMAIDAEAPLRNENIDPAGAGCIVFAVKGHGAFVRPLHADHVDVQPRRLPHHRADLTTNDVRFVTSNTIVDSALPGIHTVVADRLGVPYPGSDLVAWVLRWTTLAMGLGNATVWVYKKIDRYAKVWDHAGAMLLFEETGGKITDVHGKDIDLAAGRKMSGNFGFVAAPEEIHCQLLKTVHDVLREQGKEEFLA